MVIELAKLIMSDSDLHALGMKRLGLDQSVIYTHLRNHKAINEAPLKILISWEVEQENGDFQACAGGRNETECLPDNSDCLGGKISF